MTFWWMLTLGKKQQKRIKGVPHFPMMNFSKFPAISDLATGALHVDVYVWVYTYGRKNKYVQAHTHKHTHTHTHRHAPAHTHA